MFRSIIPFFKQIDRQIVRSKDCIVYDSNNIKYIDFGSGDWAAGLGHSHNRINRIIKKQVDILIHDGMQFRNKQSENLSTQLSEILSFHKGKSVFLNSGSEAVNLGITIAKNITNRNKILKIDCSYLAAYGHGQITANNTDLINIRFDDISSISQIHFKDVAGFVFEPGNSSGLIKYPANNFILSIASAIKQNGGLLIANEVTTGFGRTGKWFGYQHYDFKPDIVTMGKAIGNGYPISCVTITNEVSTLFDKSPFRYAQSHQNDPLGCAIGLEVINVIEDENVIQKCITKGTYFQNQLIRLKNNHNDKIRDIRARGLMLALEFDSGINIEYIFLRLIENGFLTSYKENVLRFMPPLTIKPCHIDALIDTIDKIIINI